MKNAVFVQIPARETRYDLAEWFKIMCIHFYVHHLQHIYFYIYAKYILQRTQFYVPVGYLQRIHFSVGYFHFNLGYLQRISIQNYAIYKVTEVPDFSAYFSVTTVDLAHRRGKRLVKCVSDNPRCCKQLVTNVFQIILVVANNV